MHSQDVRATERIPQSRHFSIHIRFGGLRLHFKHRNRSRNDQARVVQVIPLRPMSW